MSMSETETSDSSAHQRLIRSLELKLELLQYGLALPSDKHAIAHTRSLLEEARREEWAKRVRRSSR